MLFTFKIQLVKLLITELLENELEMCLKQDKIKLLFWRSEMTESGREPESIPRKIKVSEVKKVSAKQYFAHKKKEREDHK